MRQRLVAGNWKMHGNLSANQGLLEAVAETAGALRASRCAVCVPYPYLAQAQELLAGTRCAWGAQNLSEYEQGAYTGEVSARMLKDFGCSYVIVGHSERRHLFGETDATVAAKAQRALDSAMVPIVCVGETLHEREAGITEQVVSRQLDTVLERIGTAGLAKSVLAYEPVWAIGTGRTASPQQAEAVHAFIRAKLAQQSAAAAENQCILYGGSVKAANAAGLFKMADIDGALVGGAALDGGEFSAICRAADRETVERA
jgi:triosephosphate isomerase (TIM)